MTRRGCKDCCGCKANDIRQSGGEWTDWTGSPPAGTSNTFLPSTTAQFDILNQQPNWIVTFDILNAGSSDGTVFSAGDIELSFHLLPPPNDYDPFNPAWVFRSNVCGKESLIWIGGSLESGFFVTIAQTYIAGVLTKYVSAGSFTDCTKAHVTPPPFGDVTVQIRNGTGGVQVGDVSWSQTEEEDETCPPVNCTDTGVPCIGQVRIVTDVSAAVTGYASSQEGELLWTGVNCASVASGGACTVCDDYTREGWVRWTGLGTVNGVWPHTLVEYPNYDPVDPVRRAQVEAMPKDCNWWNIVKNWLWRPYNPLIPVTKSTNVIKETWDQCVAGGPYTEDSGEVIENPNITIDLCNGNLPGLETFYSTSDMRDPYVDTQFPTGCFLSLISETLMNTDGPTRIGTWYCDFPYVVCEPQWDNYFWDDAGVQYPNRTFSRNVHNYGAGCLCNQTPCPDRDVNQGGTQNFAFANASMTQSKSYADFNLP